MRTHSIALGMVLTAALVALPVSARAQGAVVLNGSVAAAAVDGSSGVLFGGGAGYQFNEVVGIGVELTHINSLPTDLSLPRCCGGDLDGSATVFTTNLRIEVPTTSERIIPFVVAGGGVASVNSQYRLMYALPALAALTSLPQTSLIPIGPGSTDLYHYTQTSMALTLGGGVTFLLTEHIGLDADLRLLQLMGTNDRSIGRFGGGVSFRF